MPPSKKRSAKENITAGGKKSKKVEGEKKPKPPFVCAIYRRDIASFLPRAKIQQWRQTSSHSNASLIEFPSRLPRFKYLSMMASGDQCIFQKNGFLYHQNNGFSILGEEFTSIYKFRFCCRDVRDRASKLVGNRLFPSKPDNEGVALGLKWDKRGRRTVLCCVANLLTKRTAPAMLHFLHHLSQACYEHVEIIATPAAECTFNPLVLQALPKFRLRGVKLSLLSPSNLTVEMASQMRICFNLLSYSNYTPISFVLPQLLDFITDGRQSGKRLEVEGSMTRQDVDQIIKYFEKDLRSLEKAIRDVRCENPYNTVNNSWPARCPKEAATQVTERDDGRIDYCFDFTNAHSKEPFSLTLGTRHHEGRTLLYKFHLTFDSA